MKQLQTSSNAQVRAWATSTLKTNNQYIITTVINTAKSDPNKYVQDAARLALEKLGIKVETKDVMTNWDAVEIGARAGFGFGLFLTILFISFSLTGDAQGLGQVLRMSPKIFFLPSVLEGMAGAMAGKYWKRDRLTAWGGAIFLNVLGIAGLYYVGFGF